MAIQSDFMLAINQIAAEKDIKPEEVIVALCEAIESNYQDIQGYTDNIDVYYDQDENRIIAMAKKKVVDHVEEESHEIPLIRAILIDKNVKVGDTLEVDVSKDGDFGRVAAQATRQILSQKIRRIEKDTILAEFQEKIGTIETATIQRADAKKVVVEIRKAIGLMYEEDKIPGEFYKSGTRIKVVIKDIEEKGDNRTLHVSRADESFLQALFSLEVPEIDSGSIEVKSIAREAGSRSKVAVYSLVDTLDPIGSCVGQRGVRINSIMDELKTQRGDEKVDVILWDPKMENYIANSLSPAQTISVKYYPQGMRWQDAEDYKVEGKEDEYNIDGFILKKNDSSDPTFAIEANTANVIVPDEQLSLAIGREGQNARLAAKLTKVRINVQGETELVNTNQNINVLSSQSADTPDPQEPSEEDINSGVQTPNAMSTEPEVLN